jgi:hypothetical protein
VIETAGESLSGQWLAEVRRIAKLVDKTGESLQLLAGKRATLEEMSISRYFHELTAEYGQIVWRMHSRFARDRVLPPESILLDLAEITLAVENAVDDLLRAGRYSLNYLEQYFEYDFNNKLNSEYRYLDEVRRISRALKSLDHPPGQL